MSIFGSLLKTVVDTATLPLDVAKDVVTMGGAMTERQEPYTVSKFKRLADDVEDISDEAGKL
jgi:hypothetical protein